MSDTTSISLTNPIIIVIPTEDPGAGGIGSVDVKVNYYYYSNVNGGTLTAVSDLDQVSASMHVRGESTAGSTVHKKQYAVSLDSDPAGNFLGMPHGKEHWVFNDAGQVDESFIRNPLAFHLQNSIGTTAYTTPGGSAYASQWAWAPRNKYFEMYLCDYQTPIATLDDVSSILGTYYHGIYILMEKIREQGSRIDIPNFDRHSPSTDVGFVIQINPGSDKYLPLPSQNTGAGNTTEVYDPKKKHFTPAEETTAKNWYSGWAGQFEGSTYTWADIAKTTDYTTFALYWILNEICKDGDGYTKSYYFYQIAKKVYGGPLWDKNKSFGNATLRGTSDWFVDTTNWLYQKNLSGYWISVLMKNTDYCAIIWDLWAKFYTADGGVLSYSSMEKFINDQYTYLDSANMLSRNQTSGPNPHQPWATPYLDAKNNLLAYLGGGYYFANDETKKAPVSSTIDPNTKEPIGRLAWIDQNLQTLLNTTSGFTPPAS
ncbi:MAG: CotH kinase family protein [Bacteroidota bacterium]